MITVHAVDAHGNQRISGEGKEAIVVSLGQDPLAMDPRTAPKVLRYSTFDRAGRYTGNCLTLVGAFNVGLGRDPEEARKLASEVELMIKVAP